MAYPEYIETEADYARYEADVDRGCAGLEHISTGACPGCNDCGLSEDPELSELDSAGEGHFSWHPCEACQRPLGGTRYPAHAVLDGELVHLSVCTDCQHFLEHGRLDHDAGRSRLNPSAW